MKNYLPQSRTSNIVVQETNSETLIYNLVNHKIHCLNQTSSLVWKYCDGKTNIPNLTKQLEKELKSNIDEDFVWFAVQELEKFDLLTEVSPQNIKVTRRNLFLKYTFPVLLLPAITVVSAPTPTQAQSSCINPTSCCDVALCSPIVNCCPGFICQDPLNGRDTCIPV